MSMKVDILFDIINKNKSKDDPIINLGLSISLSFIRKIRLVDYY
jgi:hypothetical protein